MRVDKDVTFYRGINKSCKETSEELSTQTVYLTRDIEIAKAYGNCFLELKTSRPVNLFELWTPEGLEVLHRLPLTSETIGNFTGEYDPEDRRKTFRTTLKYNSDGSASQERVHDPFVRKIHDLFPGSELISDGTQMRWNGLVWGENALSRNSEVDSDSLVYTELRKILEPRGFDGIFAIKTPSARGGGGVFHEEILIFNPKDTLTFIKKEDTGKYRHMPVDYGSALLMFGNRKLDKRGGKSRKLKQKRRRNTRKRTSRKVK
jgi:hypothetical protein